MFTLPRSALEVTTATIIARIGHVSNLTTHIQICVEKRFYRVQCEYSIASIHRIKKMCTAASSHRAYERVLKVLSHRRCAITRCVNAINGKIRTIYILMIVSHCTRDTALLVQCEYIIEIYKALIFPLIALTHRVIARRLYESWGPWMTAFHINLHVEINNDSRILLANDT